MAMRKLAMTFRSRHSSTMSVSIGIALCGVSPVVLRPSFRNCGSRSRVTRQTSTRSSLSRRFSSGDVEVLQTGPQGRTEDALDLRESQVRLQAPSLPVSAHQALCVAVERTVEDEDRGVNRLELRQKRFAKVSRGAGRGPGEVAQSVDLSHGTNATAAPAVDTNRRCAGYPRRDRPPARSRARDERVPCRTRGSW